MSLLSQPVTPYHNHLFPSHHQQLIQEYLPFLQRYILPSYFTQIFTLLDRLFTQIFELPDQLFTQIFTLPNWLCDLPMMFPASQSGWLLRHLIAPFERLLRHLISLFGRLLRLLKSQFYRLISLCGPLCLQLCFLL